MQEHWQLKPEALGSIFKQLLTFHSSLFSPHNVLLGSNCLAPKALQLSNQKTAAKQCFATASYKKGAKVGENCTPANIAKKHSVVYEQFNQWIFSKRTLIVSKLLSKLYPSDKLCKGLDAVLHV